ncbi:MAG TPA: molybdenum cofactor synthesis domain-containing protein [Bacteroidales bacterium]|nr:molybdenum cofactor synthesis domain-containing protein [Bacteroidales bacterium]
MSDAKQIRIVSVNISEKKGTIKEPVDAIALNNLGIFGDAHAGKWHRQVSLLGVKSLEKMKIPPNREVSYGEFAENITTEGFPLYDMKPLDRLICGDLELEVTQIGKKCHGAGCAIFKETGDCIMPKEGIFCRVLKGGTLRAGDVLQYIPRMLKIHVITMSDRAAEGVYEDKSGPLLKQLATTYFSSNGRNVEITNTIMPDEERPLTLLVKQIIQDKVDIIFTTGGTGIGPRDITPDTIRPLLDKEITGIMELIRVKYGAEKPNALISRSIAGVAGQSLIYVLPGSPKAIKEYTDEIFKTIEHSLRMLYNIDEH